MGQEEILQLLKKHKTKWFTVREIMELSGTGHSSTTRSLAKLRWYRFVQFKEVNINGHLTFVYKHLVERRRTKK